MIEAYQLKLKNPYHLEGQAFDIISSIEGKPGLAPKSSNNSSREILLPIGGVGCTPAVKLSNSLTIISTRLPKNLLGISILWFSLLGY
jgi:hypothetical protein